MPTNLVLVRHGESEGNLANALSRKGNDSMFTEEFLNRHTSTWCLTEKGKEQAKTAGKWIKENIKEPFHRFYVSEYDRAKETAGWLGIPGAEWRINFYLRERELGKLDVMPINERKRKFAENLRKKEEEPFYWIPDNGESMPEVCLRLDAKVFDTLHRECDQKNALLVVHGDIKWGFRYIIERPTHSEIMRLEHSSNPHDKIHNCQITHYTRKDPVSGKIAPHLNWVRSICPTDLSLSSNEWREIKRKKFSNEELLQEVELRRQAR